MSHHFSRFCAGRTPGCCHTRSDQGEHRFGLNIVEARRGLTTGARSLIDWTAPRAEAAAEWVTPRAKAAWQAGIQAAAPRVEEAVKALGPRIDGAHDRLREHVLPGLVTAVNRAATVAAQQAARSEAEAAAQVAAAVAATKPRRRFCRCLGWTILLGVLGGLAYRLWRRNQPTTDPWAEDAWDAESVTFTPTSQAVKDDGETEPGHGNGHLAELAEAAEDAADAVGQATGVAVRKVTDAAHKAAAKVRKATEAGKADQEEADSEAEPNQ